MIDFLQFWSALFKPPLIGWTVATQLLATATVIALNFVGWQARRAAVICVPLGALSLLVLSVPLLVLGWGFGGWDDWDTLPPPDFRDLTWLYFAGLEMGLLLLALGTAFLHRKQFKLPLLRGFFGFFFDGALNILVFTYLGNTIVSSHLGYLDSPGQSRILLFYALSGFILWLLLTWMRPTCLRALRRLRLRPTDA